MNILDKLESTATKTPQTTCDEPQPCGICQSPYFWVGPDLLNHCVSCEPPPSKLLVRGRRLVVSTPAGAAWEDYGETLARIDRQEPQEAASRDEPPGDQSNTPPDTEMPQNANSGVYCGIGYLTKAADGPLRGQSFDDWFDSLPDASDPDAWRILSTDGPQSPQPSPKTPATRRRRKK